jgi:hypothetical protein
MRQGWVRERATKTRSLHKFLKFLAGDAELTEDPLTERRTNFSPTVDGNNSDSPPVLVCPALMTAGLPSAPKSQAQGGSAEIIRASARHALFR